MAKILEVGDRCWHQPGAPVGLVIEVNNGKALVEYCWGKAYWYDFCDLERTRSPLTK